MTNSRCSKDIRKIEECFNYSSLPSICRTDNQSSRFDFLNRTNPRSKYPIKQTSLRQLPPLFLPHLSPARPSFQVSGESASGASQVRGPRWIEESVVLPRVGVTMATISREARVKKRRVALIASVCPGDERDGPERWHREGRWSYLENSPLERGHRRFPLPRPRHGMYTALPSSISRLPLPRLLFASIPLPFYPSRPSTTPRLP